MDKKVEQQLVLKILYCGLASKYGKLLPKAEAYKKKCLNRLTIIKDWPKLK